MKNKEVKIPFTRVMLKLGMENVRETSRKGKCKWSIMSYTI